MNNKPYRHPRDKDGSCSVMGGVAESAFFTTMANRGHLVEKSSKEDELSGKGDFTVDGKKIEVKSVKRARRKDANPSYDLIWIEISNVYSSSGHYSGWLYSPKIDFIAFEQEDSFIIVDRSKLAAHVESICDYVTFVSSAEKALYKSYRRFKRRGEHLTIIQVSDLKNIPHKVVPKTLSPIDSFFISVKTCMNSPYTEVPNYYTFDFESAQRKREELVAAGEHVDVVIKKRELN